MVSVSTVSTDPATAWRIRDVLAAHPVLSGATAGIEIIAHYDCVLLTGWAHDEDLSQVAARLAAEAAGKRAVQRQIRTRIHVAA